MDNDRRNYERRSEAQCRLVSWLCSRPEGATCDEAARQARMPVDGARRVLRRMAARWLVRCEAGARWKADALLLAPPPLATVEPW